MYFSVQLPMVEFDSDTKIYKINDAVNNNIPIKSSPVATSFMIFDE